MLFEVKIMWIPKYYNFMMSILFQKHVYQYAAITACQLQRLERWRYLPTVSIPVTDVNSHGLTHSECFSYRCLVISPISQSIFTQMHANMRKSCLWGRSEVMVNLVGRVHGSHGMIIFLTSHRMRHWGYFISTFFSCFSFILLYCRTQANACVDSQIEVKMIFCVNEAELSHTESQSAEWLSPPWQIWCYWLDNTPV